MDLSKRYTHRLILNVVQLLLIEISHTSMYIIDIIKGYMHCLPTSEPHFPYFF